MRLYSMIARGIESYLLSALQETSNTRRFFGLSGFDDETYRQFLAAVSEQSDRLGEYEVWVRTTAPVSDYEQYQLEEKKSATWYRNNTPPNHALVLIFNQHTSDAQSLKDIFPVTERVLLTDAIDHLIDAGFAEYNEDSFSYQLSADQRKIIKDFLKDFRAALNEPQLRDVADFLLELHQCMKQEIPPPIEAAIAYSLPHLGLFRCDQLNEVINTTKGIRMLKSNCRAASIGRELLDHVTQEGYLSKLAKATFEDDSSFGGLSSEEKRHRLYDFITEVLSDRTRFIQALAIDWEEVSEIFYKTTRQTKEDKIRKLGEDIAQALEEIGLSTGELAPDAQDAIQELSGGSTPETESLDVLLVETEDSLPRKLVNQVKRLQGVKKHSSSDFVAGITNLAIEMLSPLQEEYTDLHLWVALSPDSLEMLQSGANEEIREALFAFHIHYAALKTLMDNPAIHWDINEIWDFVDEGLSASEFKINSNEEGFERTGKSSLDFNLIVEDSDGNPLERAQLTWTYRQNSTEAATLSHLIALRDSESPGIPVYENAPLTNEIGGLDLSQPIKSFGAWYRQEENLRNKLTDQLDNRIDRSAWEQIEESLSRLEDGWATYVKEAARNGLVGQHLTSLLASYEGFLATSSKYLNTGQSANGFRAITQAWMIGPKGFGVWGVMPMLHPIKLHWWRERSRHLGNILSQLLKGNATFVDERRFRRELVAAYSSSGSAPLIVLPDRDTRPQYFLPIQELQGYELFRPIGQASMAYGLDPNLVIEDESQQAAEIAAKELTNIVSDYIETYPFVRDGLEIYLVQCKNGALPSLLVENLEKLAQRRNWSLQLNVVVHTTDRGAPLYERISEWISGNERLSEHYAGYIPRVTVKVLECGFDELYNQQDDNDLVILADVLGEKGQRIEAFEVPIMEHGFGLEGYRPRQWIRQAPFERREQTRNVLITHQEQPKMLSSFTNIQRAAKEILALDSRSNVGFRLVVSLQDWSTVLEKMHRYFNWVTCYDTTVDRFLLEATLPKAIEVIRYSLGLGMDHQHNLTVSSSTRTQEIVICRLASNLEVMLPGTKYQFRMDVATRLVEQAKAISGDIVLRAAGPGAYLNELIGMIVAKYMTERHYREQYGPSLTTWIYLDDFPHWFDRKYPDLLFVAIPASQKDYLHIEILETKCVSEDNFSVEAKDATIQVIQGVNRLAQAWRSGSPHLDAEYWYDQLYRAVVGNLIVDYEQQAIWEEIRERLVGGQYMLDMSGHAWVCAYDGSAGISGAIEIKSKQPAPDAPDIHIMSHHISRLGLRQCLRELAENWNLPIAPGDWDHDPGVFLGASAVPPSAHATAVKEDHIPVEDALAGQEMNGAPVGLEAEDTEIDNKMQTWLAQKAQDLTRTLRDYGVRVRPIELEQAEVGPSIVRFKVKLYPGERLGQIQRVSEDLQRGLGLDTVPFVGNVSGTTYVGIDIPHPNPEPIYQADHIEKLEDIDGLLPFLVGVTPSGETRIEDLASLYHLLIAGSTGSGKTIFLYTLLVSLLYRLGLERVRLLLIDPKQTDFIFFDGLPNLLGDKVLIEPEEAIEWLDYLTEQELPTRTEQLRNASCRDMIDYNAKFPDDPMLPIVVIIDEYADLVQILDKQGRKAFEHSITRLAQRARNVGIHLVIATQRPSADIVTTRLKTNLPARIAFRLPSYHDSGIILDEPGAENLIGRGDMLFKHEGSVMRLQSFYVHSEDLVQFLNSMQFLGSKSRFAD